MIAAMKLRLALGLAVAVVAAVILLTGGLTLRTFTSPTSWTT